MGDEVELEDTVYLNAFLLELQTESDRAAALVAAAVIDLRLADNLSAFMVSDKAAKTLLKGANAPLGTFSARINAAFALALIDEKEQGQCHIIRRIRNEFAHSEHGISFKTARIVALCDQLGLHFGHDLAFYTENSRMRFNHCVTKISVCLHYRVDSVREERLVTRPRPPFMVE